MHPSHPAGADTNNFNIGGGGDGGGGDDDDDDDGDLLVSDVRTMRRVSSFTHLAHLPVNRAAAESGAAAPISDRSAGRLKLSMDYSAAADTINTALAKDSSGTRTPLLTCGSKAFSADAPVALALMAANAGGGTTVPPKVRLAAWQLAESLRRDDAT
jgi:hypothetical protein